jgi:hypothetical protein
MALISYKVRDLIDDFSDGNLLMSTSDFYSYVDANPTITVGIQVNKEDKFILTKLEPENPLEKISWVNYKNRKKTEVEFNTLVFHLYDFVLNRSLKHVIYFKDMDSLVEIPFQKIA